MSIKVEGMQELLRKLKQLDTRSGRKVLRKGTNAAAKPLVRAVKSAAPVGPTKNLRRSIGKKSKFYRTSTTDVAIIGPRIGTSKDYRGYHGHLVEEGTKERTVKDWMGLKKRGLVKKAIRMRVGKMTPNPFTKRAADSVMELAGHKGLDALRKALIAEFKALGFG